MQKSALSSFITSGWSFLLRLGVASGLTILSTSHFVWCLFVNFIVWMCMFL